MNNIRISSGVPVIIVKLRLKKCSLERKQCGLMKAIEFLGQFGAWGGSSPSVGFFFLVRSSWGSEGGKSIGGG